MDSNSCTRSSAPGLGPLKLEAPRTYGASHLFVFISLGAMRGVLSVGDRHLRLQVRVISTAGFKIQGLLRYVCGVCIANKL